MAIIPKKLREQASSAVAAFLLVFCLAATPITAEKNSQAKDQPSRVTAPPEMGEIDISIWWHRHLKTPVSIEEKQALHLAQPGIRFANNEFKFQKFLTVDFPKREEIADKHSPFKVTTTGQLGEYDFSRKGFKDSSAGNTFRIEFGKVTITSGKNIGSQCVYKATLSSGPDLSFIPYPPDAAEKLITALPSRQVTISFTFEVIGNDPEGSASEDLDAPNFIYESIVGRILSVEISAELPGASAANRRPTMTHKTIFSFPKT